MLLCCYGRLVRKGLSTAAKDDLLTIACTCAAKGYCSRSVCRFVDRSVCTFSFELLYQTWRVWNVVVKGQHVHGVRLKFALMCTFLVKTESGGYQS